MEQDVTANDKMPAFIDSKIAQYNAPNATEQDKAEADYYINLFIDDTSFNFQTMTLESAAELKQKNQQQTYKKPVLTKIKPLIIHRKNISKFWI